MSNDKMREEFEAWFKERSGYKHLERCGETYFGDWAACAWMGFQAARAGTPDMTAARAAIRQALPDVPGDSLDHGLLAAFEAAGLGVRS